MLSPNIFSDIASFWDRSWLSSGQVSYSSSGAFLEYPPLSGIILYAARIFGGSYAGYYVSFSALSLLAAAGIVWSSWRLAKDLGVRINPLHFLLPSMIIYGIYNFDLFDALFIVLALQLFVEKRRGWSALFLGVAIVTKFVAGVLIPILLLELVGWKERVQYLVIAGACAAAFFAPIAIFSPGYFAQFASFYSSWGLEDAWYI